MVRESKIVVVILFHSLMMELFLQLDQKMLTNKKIVLQIMVTYVFFSILQVLGHN